MESLEFFEKCSNYKAKKTEVEKYIRCLLKSQKANSIINIEWWIYYCLSILSELTNSELTEIPYLTV